MKRNRRPTRLPRWQEWAVYLSFGLLLTTGLSWLLLDWLVRVPGEFGPVHHPAEHWALIAHGAAAYAFLIVAGTIIPIHIVVGWNIGRNLKSGLALLGGLLVLAVTALGLYYLGGESSRRWTSIVHWAIGVAVLLLLALHVIKGRRPV